MISPLFWIKNADIETGWNVRILRPVWIISAKIRYLLSEQKKFQNKSKNIDEVYQSEFFRCIMLLLYRVTFLCNVFSKFIIHQKALCDIFYEKVVKWRFDSIIARKSTTAFCGHYMFDEDGNKKDGVHLTRFYTGIKQRACYQVNTHENLAFGLAVAHLMMALNFIKLDNMPWDLIFNTAKMPNKEERDRFMQLVETDKGC